MKLKKIAVTALVLGMGLAVFGISNAATSSCSNCNVAALQNQLKNPKFLLKEMLALRALRIEQYNAGLASYNKARDNYEKILGDSVDMMSGKKTLPEAYVDKLQAARSAFEDAYHAHVKAANNVRVVDQAYGVFAGNSGMIAQGARVLAQAHELPDVQIYGEVNQPGGGISGIAFDTDLLDISSLDIPQQFMQGKTDWSIDLNTPADPALSASVSQGEVYPWIMDGVGYGPAWGYGAINRSGWMPGQQSVRYDQLGAYPSYDVNWNDSGFLYAPVLPVDVGDDIAVANPEFD